MSCLRVGDRIPDFRFDTVEQSGCRFSDWLVKEDVTGADKKAAVIFLRYYGCTLCQYDIFLYAKAYQEITEGGGRFCIVLQSSAESVKKQLAKKKLPFSIICDPEKKLYRAFEIQPAHTKEELLGDGALEKIVEAKKLFVHGAYEGDELQKPAVFVLDGTRRLHYVHYGVSVADVPKPEELKKLLS